MSDLPALPDGFERLPKKWQKHVLLLRANLDYAYRRLSDGPEGAVVHYDPYGDNLPLGNGTDSHDQVRFRVGEFEHIDVRWSGADYTRHEDPPKHETLEISCEGGLGLVVEPWSSNVIRVRIKQRTRPLPKSEEDM